jgi:hypothetical protein
MRVVPRRARRRGFARIALARASLWAAGMKSLVCLLAMTATAAAESPTPVSPVEQESSLSVGVGVDLAIERLLAATYQLQGGFQLRPGYWVDAAVGLGAASLLDPAGSGQGDSRVYEGRVGLARFGCKSGLCGGVIGSLGFHHQSIDFEDSLVQPEMWTETRDLVFGEARAVGRLMFGRYVALEAALGGRLHGAVHTERAQGGFNLGVVGGLGLHAML